jgi:hypothetical protein
MSCRTRITNQYHFKLGLRSVLHQSRSVKPTPTVTTIVRIINVLLP